MSSLGWLVKDYIEVRNGRISVWGHVYLFLDRAEKRKKRLARRGGSLFAEMADMNGRQYALFRGRGMKCQHPSKWTNLFPQFNKEGRRPYFVVPRDDCRACEFHEPAKRYGRKRYPSCRWFRENSGMDSALSLLAKSVTKAEELLK
jgi:hypothetical protein